jgi:hypothetical protein
MFPETLQDTAAGVITLTGRQGTVGWLSETDVSLPGSNIKKAVFPRQFKLLQV